MSAFEPRYMRLKCFPNHRVSVKTLLDPHPHPSVSQHFFHDHPSSSRSLSRVFFFFLIPFLNCVSLKMLYFEIIIEPQAVAKTVQRDPVYLPSGFPQWLHLPELSHKVDVGTRCVGSSMPFYLVCRFVQPQPQSRDGTAHHHQDLLGLSPYSPTHPSPFHHFFPSPS